MKKEFEILCASKLAPGFQSPFSVCFANPFGFAERTAAEVACAFRYAVSLRRNEREAQAQPPKQYGRPITLRVIARVKRAEKESEDQRIELNRIPEIHSLLHTACRRRPTKDRLSGWVWEGALAFQSRLPNVLPHFFRPTSSSISIVISFTPLRSSASTSTRCSMGVMRAKARASSDVTGIV